MLDPEESRVAVPDDRFDWLVTHTKPNKVIPAFVSKNNKREKKREIYNN